jgi:hypothetical protein
LKVGEDVHGGGFRFGGALQVEIGERIGRNDQLTVRVPSYNQKLKEDRPMKRVLLTAALLFAGAGLSVQAQDTKTPTDQSPTTTMDKATPDMKSDTKGQQPPTKAMGDAVPPMKPGDKPSSPDTPSTTTPGTSPSK